MKKLISSLLMAFVCIGAMAEDLRKERLSCVLLLAQWRNRCC